MFIKLAPLKCFKHLLIYINHTFINYQALNLFLSLTKSNLQILIPTKVRLFLILYMYNIKQDFFPQ